MDSDALLDRDPLEDLLGGETLPDDLLPGVALLGNPLGDLLGDVRLPDDLLGDDRPLVGDTLPDGTELLLEADRLPSRGDLDLTLLDALLDSEAVLLESLDRPDIFTTTLK
jgi:hypothetical protein